MAAKYEVTAEPRTVKGSGASRRLRRAGKVPGIVYGAGKDAVPVSFDHNMLLRQLAEEKFHTSILTLTLNGSKDQAILRDYHMHPVNPQVLHVDLQRISATEKIHMRIPLHFVGQDVAPGVKQEGGLISHLMTEVDVTCLPHQLPDFLEVDMANVHLNESVHMSDIKMPEGVQITQLARGGEDLAVATIRIVKEEVIEAPVVEAVAAAPGEAAAAAPGAAPAAPGAAPAAGAAAPADAKKGDAAKKAEAPKKPEGKKEGK